MILYRWCLAPAALPALLADGWRVVAEHPVYAGRSLLLRKDA